MKTTNNYEAPVAEMIEMNMPVVLMASATSEGPSGTPSFIPPVPVPNP